MASGARFETVVKELSELARRARTNLEGGEPAPSSMRTWSMFEETVDRLKKSVDSKGTSYMNKHFQRGGLPHQHLSCYCWSLPLTESLLPVFSGVQRTEEQEAISM